MKLQVLQLLWHLSNLPFYTFFSQVPEEVRTASLWEYFTDWTNKLLRPFKLDPNEVPPLPKKFTCVFQISKEYLWVGF